MLILLRGLPGSGKTTFAERLFDGSLVDYEYSADQYFDLYYNGVFSPTALPDAHHWCQKSVENSISKGYIVVVHNTSTTESEVKIYQDIADQYGVQFVSLIVENRHGNKSVHNVPETTMEKMRKRFSVKL